MSVRRAAVALLVPLLMAGLATPAIADRDARDGGPQAHHSLRGPVTDENFYFVMADRFANGDTGNDRGGLGDDPLVSGFDPAKKGFYNGGDLAGLRGKLDYIQDLGTTSIWLTPSFKNKAVQLEDGPSAGYHGYWITDFTQIDPHLGTNDDLAALIDDAHGRGMKVYFDIITNHTADVIGYEEGARKAYTPKDASPYTTADGTVFDDRDHAGGDDFPALDPATSFPYTPVLDPAEQNLKVPTWLNDVTLYHNRGDTTFVGEDSQYGDFFGLDDLFTENPRVVDGMVEIYQRWIKDFGIDGFRIDTMKHVDDAFWQQFGPRVLKYAQQHGKREFFMFGEVFDTTKSYTSHFTTTDTMQSVLDFPFQDAAREFAASGAPTDNLATFFADDDWYTDADSNVYELPTFLGNHDMGRFGGFVVADNPGAGDNEWMARDRLGHELMYFSRGNPVIYYGDEQGFTGPGGDQDARQTLFASQVPEYLDDDLLGTDATHATDNYNTRHPLYRTIAGLASVTERHPALRDGVHQSRLSSASAGVYAFSRIDRRQQREYVVALNNSEAPVTAAVPTYTTKSNYSKVYGTGPAHAKSGRDGKLTVTVPALSTMVYALDGRIPRSHQAPAISLKAPAPAAQGRVEIAADVRGSSLYEVSFEARAAGGRWQSIGTDDNAPYRVFHDTTALDANTPVEYRAVVLDNGGHKRASGTVLGRVPAPKLTIEAPAEDGGVRGTVEVRASADPEKATHVVSFERSVDGGPWTAIGSDSTSPAYTVFDDLGALNLAAGTPVAYRATLGGARSEVRTVRYAGPQLEVATLRYLRPAGDYGQWGLHLWGDGIDPAVLAQVAWDKPWPATRVEDGWAVYEIPLVDDTKPVNFIMHLPSGDAVPDTREPGGDRSFRPIDTPEVWIKQGDPAVYTSEPQ
ncbi:MAG: alpha-amylase family glycosyl hydrolase [Actinophytocola sp.]|uniref:alpha-amylase family glycosyl hydrolase n=1 Tax=Actinophytocola sp. TaxID=1872138 RepID=UPI003C77DD4C